MKYQLKLDIPLDFYAEQHRPSHFLQFAAVENDGLTATGAGVSVGAAPGEGVDREDEFA